MPLLSIIIPVYNAEKTIARTLDSLRRLSPDSKKISEVVIVDDGTPDRSMDIVAETLTALTPFAVSVASQNNQGLAAARNTGIRQSTGEYLFFLDADDELAFDPIPHLLRHPDASALGFAVRYVRGGTPLGLKKPPTINARNHLDVFTAENALTASSIVFKKDRITSIFNADFRSLEDWYFWLMNPGIFHQMLVLPEVVSAYIHIHGGNMTASREKMGLFRERVARAVAQEYEGRLTEKQRNNLEIQSCIGLIQQGKPVPARAMALFPCSVKLYGILILYALFRNKIGLIDRYGATPK